MSSSSFIIGRHTPSATKEMDYGRYKMDAMPPPPLDNVAPTLRKIVAEVESKPWATCRAEADRGNLASMVDLGLR